MSVRSGSYSRQCNIRKMNASPTRVRVRPRTRLITMVWIVEANLFQCLLETRQNISQNVETSKRTRTQVMYANKINTVCRFAIRYYNLVNCVSNELPSPPQLISLEKLRRQGPSNEYVIDFIPITYIHIHIGNIVAEANCLLNKLGGIGLS